VTGATLRKVIADHVNMPASDLHTDSAKYYQTLGAEFASHQAVNHEAGEYVHGQVSTNQAENFFSQLKRSIDGTHHHVSKTHLPRVSGRVRLPGHHPSRGRRDPDAGPDQPCRRSTVHLQATYRRSLDAVERSTRGSDPPNTGSTLGFVKSHIASERETGPLATEDDVWASSRYAWLAGRTITVLAMRTSPLPTAVTRPAESATRYILSADSAC
jgi:hypothetical protein